MTDSGFCLKRLGIFSLLSCLSAISVGADEPGHSSMHPPVTSSDSQHRDGSEIEPLLDGLRQDLDAWSERHGERWETWAEQLSRSMQRWAEEQEDVWQAWGERYERAMQDLEARHESQPDDAQDESLQSAARHESYHRFGEMADLHLRMLGEIPLSRSMRSAFTIAADQASEAPWESIADLEPICERLMTRVHHELEQLTEHRGRHNDVASEVTPSPDMLHEDSHQSVPAAPSDELPHSPAVPSTPAAPRAPLLPDAPQPPSVSPTVIRADQQLRLEQVQRRLDELLKEMTILQDEMLQLQQSP